MKRNKIAIAAFLVFSIQFNGYAQKIKGRDASDLYIQHQAIKKGDVFQFVNGNMNKRSNLGEFDNNDKTGDQPSFKMYYPEKKQEIYFFRLRHPLVIEPYTAYELSFKYKSADLKGEGLFLEVVVYDDTRETQVESHKAIIKDNQAGWTQRVIRIETKNKGRFARLLIKSNPGSSGQVLVDIVLLKQVSLAGELKPPVQRVVSTGVFTPGKRLAVAVNELPAEKTFYAVSFIVSWKKFAGTMPVKIEWLATKEGVPALAVDYFDIKEIKGLQSRWDGVNAEWKRETGTSIDNMSREKQKLYGKTDGTGTGTFLFKTDKPAGAKFIRISGGPGSVAGYFEIQDIIVEAEL